MSSPDGVGLLDGVKLATKLERGDRVLLVVDQTFTPEHVDDARDYLKQRFPGVEFTFACGVSDMAVLPAGLKPIPRWVTEQAVPARAPKEQP